MAEKTSDQYCNSSLNLEQITKFIKIKRISEECTRENGKKYVRVEWQDSWIEENEVRKVDENILEEFKTQPKPKIEIFAYSENKEDESQVIVLRIPKNSVKNTTDGISIHGYEGAALIDRLNEERDKYVKEQSGYTEQEKIVSYSQLEKAGYMDGDEGMETTPQQSYVTVEHTNEPGTHFTITNENNNEHEVRFLNYDVMPSMTARDDNDNSRRLYTPRRRQPFQLYKCDLCDSEFVHRTHLTIHKRTHTGEKPYRCNFCGRGFAQKGNLHVHQKIHTGEKDFVCEICHRAFITNAQLFVHMRTHTNPNKKRPHVTGRPVKHMDAPIKKENERLCHTKSSLANVLVRLVQPSNNGRTNSTTSQTLLHPPQVSAHQNTAPNPRIPTTNNVTYGGGAQAMNNSQVYMTQVHHPLPPQPMQDTNNKNQLSTSLANIPMSNHEGVPVQHGREPLYTMQSVSQAGLVVTSTTDMVQLLVPQS